MSLRPLMYGIKVPASVCGAEVGIRSTMTFHPVGRDNADIGVTHNKLSQHLDAVISKNRQLKKAVMESIR